MSCLPDTPSAHVEGVRKGEHVKLLDELEHRLPLIFQFSVHIDTSVGMGLLGFSISPALRTLTDHYLLEAKY